MEHAAHGARTGKGAERFAVSLNHTLAAPAAKSSKNRTQVHTPAVRPCPAAIVRFTPSVGLAALLLPTNDSRPSFATRTAKLVCPTGPLAG